MPLTLDLLPHRLTIARLGPGEPVPVELLQSPICSITRTPQEVSIVAPESMVPDDWRREDGWRALRVAGPLDFALTGVLSSLAGPLAAADVPIFAISTFDTDHVLVRQEHLATAVHTLRAAGHVVRD